MRKSVFLLGCWLFLTAPCFAERINGNQYLGCAHRENFEKLSRYATQGDKDAFVKAATIYVMAGECVVLEDQEEVFLADTAIFSGLVKVRRKGKLAEYWTNIEAISKPAAAIQPAQKAGGKVSVSDVKIMASEIQAIYEQGVSLPQKYDFGKEEDLKKCVQINEPLRRRADKLREKAKTLENHGYRTSLYLAADAAFSCIFCGGSGETCKYVPQNLAEVRALLAKEP